jgi:lipoprotein-releasing system ATP-binding protein
MLLNVEHLDKRFGGAVPLQVLYDINFQMAEGDFAALVGPSGAGKTTLLNIVSTLDTPSAGRVLIADTDVHRLGQRRLNDFRNHHLGFIFQDDLLLSQLTAIENVMVPGRIARKPVAHVRRRAKAVLDQVGLADRMNHRPGELSGGQRQRVNLARALLNEPALLLADEPTARLDQETGRGIVQLLERLNEDNNVTILMVTHEWDVAARAKRMVEFLDGRIVGDRKNTAGVRRL